MSQFPSGVPGGEGLNYPINIGGDWATQLAAFRAEIAAIRTELASLSAARKSASTGTGSGSGNAAANTTNQKKAFDAYAEALKLYNKELEKKQILEQRGIVAAQNMFKVETQVNTSLQSQSDALQKLTRLRNDLLVNSNKTFQQEKARLTAQKELIALQQKEADNQARVALGLQPKGVPAAVVPKSSDIRSAAIAFLGLKTNLNDVLASANRTSFSFTRLFEIFVAFRLFRGGVSFFTQMVKDLISVNAFLETTRNGLAGLFLAVGKVEDAFGNVVTPVQAFVLAQKEARRQMDLLRRDALETTGTLEELVQAFQVAVGPGLNAGFNIDQIRGLAVRISQAAQALGLSQNQLSEEIRSLLSGTISTRNTRIATALGITNEDIKRAKEAGTLADFLTAKFAAFGQVGKESLNTLNGLFNQVRTALSVLLSQGGLQFFEKFKKAVKEVFDFLATRDPISDLLTPNPKAVVLISAIGDELGNLTEEALKFVKSLDFETIQVFFQSLGTSIRVVGQIVLGITAGVVTAFSALSVIIQKVAGAVNFVLGLFGAHANVSEFAKSITVIALAFSALKIALIPIAALIQTGVYVKLAIQLSLATARMLGLTAATTANTAAMAANATATATAGATTGAAAASTTVFAVALTRLRSVLAIIGGALLSFVKLPGVLFGVAAAVGAIAGQLLLMLKPVRLFAAEFAAAVLSVKVIAEEMFSEIKNPARVDQRLAEIGEGLANLKKEIEAGAVFKGQLFGKDNTNEEKKDALVTGMEEVKVKTASVADEFDHLGVIIEGNRKLISEEIEVVNKLKDAAKEANKAFQIDAGSINLPGFSKRLEAIQRGNSSLGVAGSVSASRKQIIETLQLTFDEDERLTKEKIGLEEQLNRVKAQQLVLEVKMHDLSEGEAKIVASLTDSFRERARLEDQIFRSQSRIGELRDQLKGQSPGSEAAQGIRDEIAAELEKISVNKLAIEQEIKKENSFNDQAAANGKILDRVRERIALSGTALTIQERIHSVEEDQNALAQARNDLLDLQITRINERAIAELSAANKINAIEANTATILAAREKLTNQQVNAGKPVDARQAEIEQLALQIQLENEQVTQRQHARQIEIATSEENVRLLTEQGVASDTVLSEQVKLNLLKTQNVALTEKETAELNRQIEILKQKEFEQQRPFQAGAARGLSQLTSQWTDMVQVTADLVRDSVTQLADFISQSISAAFDPNNDKTLKQRFGEFLKSIGDMLIQMFVRVALAKSILGLVSFFGGAAAGSPQSAANFGSVGQSRNGGRIRPRGLRMGGNLREGIHPSDTVPTWLTPGEWVIRPESVNKYGNRVMSAINEGLIDPTSLRALAGSRIARMASRGPGYASGGLIEAARGVADASREAAMRSEPSRSVVVADNQAFDRLLAGGANAHLQHMARNAPAYRAALGIK